MNKRTSKIAYTTIAVLILSVSITPMLSLAAAKEEHVNRGLAILRGYGIATDKHDDQVYRSGIRLAGEVKVKANDNADASNQFNILRGGIVIIDNDTRTVYTVVNDTWSGTAGKRRFVANGAVQDAEGNEYRVHLKGEAVRRTQRGILMLVEGELNGDGVSYKLLYIAVLKYRQLRTPIPIAE